MEHVAQFTTTTATENWVGPWNEAVYTSAFHKLRVVQVTQKTIPAIMHTSVLMCTADLSTFATSTAQCCNHSYEVVKLASSLLSMLLQGNVYTTELCSTCPHNEAEPTETIVPTPCSRASLPPEFDCCQTLPVRKWRGGKLGKFRHIQWCQVVSGRQKLGPQRWCLIEDSWGPSLYCLRQEHSQGNEAVSI